MMGDLLTNVQIAAIGMMSTARMEVARSRVAIVKHSKHNWACISNISGQLLFLIAFFLSEPSRDKKQIKKACNCHFILKQAKFALFSLMINLKSAAGYSRWSKKVVWMGEKGD
jgi:hypothetical protein